MKDWIRGTTARLGRLFISIGEATDCGTTCCIAGWFELESPPSKRIGTDPGQTLQAALLGKIGPYNGSFDHPIKDIVFQGFWPEPFRTQFRQANGDYKLEAQIAAARIDYLIETGN
jgi:hypothetical protein